MAIRKAHKPVHLWECPTCHQQGTATQIRDARNQLAQHLKTHQKKEDDQNGIRES
jgi:predicted FMN-binding regulatory protein PaiB